MYESQNRIYLLLLYLLLVTVLPMQAKETIRGIVRDSVSAEGLPFASIRIDNGKVTSLTDSRGLFEISIPDGAATINVYCQGYSPKTVGVSKGFLQLYDIALTPESQSLNEVVVERKGYSKRNNPAVEFAKRIKRHAKDTDPKNNDFYSFDRYERVAMGIADFDSSAANAVIRKMPFLTEHVDTSEIDGKPVLNLSVKEKSISSYYRRSPQAKKEILHGIRSNGIDEFVGHDNMQVIFDELLPEVDLYDNDIILFRNSFVSPLSPLAPDFYRFYLVDSAAVIDKDGPNHIVLAFYPHNKSSFGFKGHLYVAAADTAMLVRRAEMEVSDGINLNYVKSLKITQYFDQSDNGSRLKRHDNLYAVLQIMPNTPEVYISRKISMTGHDFDRPENADSIFSIIGRDIAEEGSDIRDDAFWRAACNIDVPKGEERIDELMTRLRSKPLFYWGEKILKILVQGYIPISDKFDYGPVNTTVSYNSLEGLRLRAGGATTASLNPHIFGKGYVAYGFRDRKWKYEAECEYSFNKKKHHPNEFPIHSIKGTHSYDIDRLGAHYLYTSPDNFVLSLSRMPDRRFTYRRLSSLTYTLELNNHLSFKLALESIREEESPYVLFETVGGNRLNHYNENVLSFDIRYSPGETFYQARSFRIPVNYDAPVFELSHRWAPKGVVGSTFGINRTELSVSKDFNLSILGRLRTQFSGGHVWCPSPFPELFIPNANLSYTIQPQSFALMNPMEFINSTYGALHVSWHLRGALFNLIPGFRKLRLREIFSFSGMYGRLAENCNPAVNSELLTLPEGTASVRMSHPYMEVSAGIDNIFTCLRIDYVRRMSYRSVPYIIDRQGLRVALHFTF